jgi:SPOR domain
MRTVLIPAKQYLYRWARQSDARGTLKLAAYALTFGAGFAIGAHLVGHEVLPARHAAVIRPAASVLERRRTRPSISPSVINSMPPRVALPVITLGKTPDLAAPSSPAVSQRPHEVTKPVPASAPHVSEPGTSQRAEYRVQVGAFMIREYAQELVDQLRSHHYLTALVALAASPPYRVWIKGDVDRPRAERLMGKLRKDGFDAVAVKMAARSCEGRAEPSCAAPGTVDNPGTPVRIHSGAAGRPLKGKGSDSITAAAALARAAAPGEYPPRAQSTRTVPPSRLRRPFGAMVHPTLSQPEPIAPIQVAPGIPALIVPGQSVGGAKLGATLAEFTRLFGNATDTVRLADGSVTQWWLDASKQKGFGARVADNGRVDRLFLMNDARYKTLAGLAVGSTEPEVRMALGVPTIAIDTHSRKEILRYDHLGVGFEIQLDPKSAAYATVVQIDIVATAAPVNGSALEGTKEPAPLNTRVGETK